MRRRTKGQCRPDKGAVTAETAIALPVLVVLLLAGLWAVGVVVANIRCVDAARDAARAVARGEPAAEAQRIGEQAAPPGATVRIDRAGSDVRVVVSAAVDLDWALLKGLPSVQVGGNATVQAEPGVEETPR
jgi:Flp pilus assembly protein TadG